MPKFFQNKISWLQAKKYPEIGHHKQERKNSGKIRLIHVIFKDGLEIVQKSRARTQLSPSLTY